MTSLERAEETEGVPSVHVDQIKSLGRCHVD